MISNNLTEFAGRAVVELADVQTITADIAVAVRYNEYQDPPEKKLDVAIASLAGRPDASELHALVIGNWGETFAESSAGAIEALAAAAPSFPRLTAVFVADLVMEESEISWIQQSDMAPLLTAYPGLEVLTIRGAEGLRFNNLGGSHGLKSLRIEAGGIGAPVIQDLTSLDLPALESLELWLGRPDYGGNVSIDDIANLVSQLPPSVDNLALANSEIAPAIAAALPTWPVLAQLDRLDLSMGLLQDDHVRAMLAAGSFDHLTQLDLTQNFLTTEYANEIGGTSTNIRAIGQREPDGWDGEVYYYTAVGE